MITGPVPPRKSSAIDPDILAFLESGLAFGGERPARHIDTHAASIFLSADRAWKLKRPVDLGYLDFSTADARHAALAAEDRLNRRTAPGLYHGLHAITRSDAGVLALDGPGAPLDWLLEMDRFSDDALLSDRAARGQLEPAMLLSLADAIARFHGGATIMLGPGAARRFQAIADGNEAAMACFPTILDPERVQALSDRVSALVSATARRLETRGCYGHVRHCHGDLHLANIALIKGVPTPFDCLEFDEGLATIDTLYDLAFLLMDLWRWHLPFEANLIANRYLDLVPAEEDAIGLLPLFMAVRAQIRAHVAAARAERSASLEDGAEAQDDLSLAERLLQPVRPRLVAIGGLSGSGKSTIARLLAGELGRPPGARILRSDVLRKQRAGVPLEMHLPPGSYAADERQAVYADLVRHASVVVNDGQALIADAVFVEPEHRAMIRAAAEAYDVDFTGIWLEAPERIRTERVLSRGPDASDATPAVIQSQGRERGAIPDDWIRVDAHGPVDKVLADIRVQLALPLSGV